MRLINANTLKLENYGESDTPPYFVLSHRWGVDEVTFQDMNSGDATHKQGFTKILELCKKALEHKVQHVWIDTCCIDKTSSSELSEAINTMYQWYTDAERCIAVLLDVTIEEELKDAEWFERGWTLQELLAPKEVDIYNSQWKLLGSRSQLKDQIAAITGIPSKALEQPFHTCQTYYSIAQRMSWAANRKTTRTEDTAYCLMGLFGVNMPLLYGEGHKAFVRLQMEIIKESEDETIFAWTSDVEERCGLLATSPKYFSGCDGILFRQNYLGPLTHIEPDGSQRAHVPWQITNRGLSIRLSFFVWPVAMDTYLVFLNCYRESDPEETPIGICLEYAQEPDSLVFTRVTFIETRPPSDYRTYAQYSIPLNIFVPQPKTFQSLIPQKVHGFRVVVEDIALQDGSYSNKFSIIHPKDALPSPFENIMAIPNSTEGTAGMIVPDDPNSKFDYIRLGFDAEYFPVIQIHERVDGQDIPSVDSYDWMRDCSQHPGALKIFPYSVIHERQSWYFGVPWKHIHRRVFNVFKPFINRLRGTLMLPDQSTELLKASLLKNASESEVRRFEDETDTDTDSDSSTYAKPKLPSKAYYPNDETAFKFPGVPNIAFGFQIPRLDLSILLNREIHERHFSWKICVSKYNPIMKLNPLYATIHPKHKNIFFNVPYKIEPIGLKWHKTTSFEYRHDSTRSWREIYAVGFKNEKFYLQGKSSLESLRTRSRSRSRLHMGPSSYADRQSLRSRRRRRRRSYSRFRLNSRSRYGNEESSEDSDKSRLQSDSEAEYIRNLRSRSTRYSSSEDVVSRRTTSQEDGTRSNESDIPNETNLAAPKQDKCMAIVLYTPPTYPTLHNDDEGDDSEVESRNIWVATETGKIWIPGDLDSWGHPESSDRYYTRDQPYRPYIPPSIDDCYERRRESPLVEYGSAGSPYTYYNDYRTDSPPSR